MSDIFDGPQPYQHPGRAIATRRKELKLSQTQLAERLHISQSAVAEWEKGKSRPRPALWEGIAKELNVDISFFVPEIQVNILANSEEEYVNLPDGEESNDIYVRLLWNMAHLVLKTEGERTSSLLSIPQGLDPRTFIIMNRASMLAVEIWDRAKEMEIDSPLRTRVELLFSIFKTGWEAAAIVWESTKKPEK